MKEIEELRKKLNILKGQIDKYEKKLSREDNYSISPISNEEKIKLEEKIYDLRCELYKIEKTIEVSSTIPIISSEVVDLYKDDKSPRGYYTVCLHNSKTIVGEVGCNNANNNVHYRIATEYRNKGYGFQALVTMLDYLILNNFENITIIIEKENIPSLKLAEKLKVLFPFFNKKEDTHYIFYQFDLNKRIVEEHKASRK